MLYDQLGSSIKIQNISNLGHETREAREHVRHKVREAGEHVKHRARWARQRLGNVIQ